METVVANISGGIRRDQLQGREHIVAPLSLIVPGVLNGNKGPLYYPLDELAKNPHAWNGVPIVIDHPYINNQPVSARDVDILNHQGIGVVLKSAVNGKLIAEGWFDVERVKALDQRILNALETGATLELSTGLWSDEEESKGFHNNREYRAIARNLRPDHLAVFADKTGACSVQDGCGVNVNEKSLLQRIKDLILGENTSWTEHHARHDQQSHGRGKGGKKGSVGGTSVAATPTKKGISKETHPHAERAAKSASKMMTAGKSEGEIVSKLSAEGISSVDITEGLARAKKIQNLKQTLPGKMVTVKPGTTKLSREGKTFEVTSVTDIGSVVVKSSGGASIKFRPEQLIVENLEASMDREKVINNLITNCPCWDEEDRETLNEFDDEKLQKLNESVEKSKATELVANAAREGFEDQQGNAHTFNAKTGKWESKFKAPKNKDGDASDKGKEGDPTANQSSEPKPLTEEEWLAQAPVEVREDIQFARNEKARQKQQLLNQITANVEEKDAKERLTNRLKDKTLDELQDLAVLSPVPQQQSATAPIANYLGSAVPTGHVPDTNNEVDKEDTLEIYTLNESIEEEERAKAAAVAG